MPSAVSDVEQMLQLYLPIVPHSCHPAVPAGPVKHRR